MIDQKEIQRVQTIHRMLDDAASRPASGQELHITVDGVTTTYTEEEVRSWPEVKRQLEHYMRSSSSWVAGVLWIYRAATNFAAQSSIDGYPPAEESQRRGLIVYREMLEPKRDTIPVLRGIDPAEDAPVDFNEMAKRINDTHARIAASFNETVKRLSARGACVRATNGDSITLTVPPNSAAVFPVGSTIAGIQTGAVLNKKRTDPYRGHDIAADKLVAALTYEHPTNVRARKVAHLRAELDRPIGFPAEGRSERAMPDSNLGMRRA